MRNVLLVLNTLVLVVLSILLAYLIVKHVGIRRLARRGIDRLGREYTEKRLQWTLKRYARTVSVKMTWIEKIELYLIDRSNIRHYIPFMNYFTLILLSSLIFAFLYGPVYRVFYFAPSTVIICLLFSLIPFFILDLMGRYNSEKIRRKLAEFISVLNRWCAVKEDIFYAFEKAVDSSVGEPLSTFIRDMVIQVNRGIEPLEALEILNIKVNNPQFKDFIVNIKQVIKHRGDIRKLLTNMEAQFYKIEEEYNRRKISTYKDRLIIYVVMFLVLIVGFYFIKSNPKIEQYYLGTVTGKSLLTLFCLMYAVGFLLTVRIARFNH